MRQILAIFAAVAILLSGIHAGPAEAHENDLGHASAFHIDQNDDDGSKQPMKGDQHGCHHHCPTAAASHPNEPDDADYYAGASLFALDTAPLVSTSRAPPLNPPKA